MRFLRGGRGGGFHLGDEDRAGGEYRDDSGDEDREVDDEVGVDVRGVCESEPDDKALGRIPKEKHKFQS